MKAKLAPKRGQIVNLAETSGFIRFNFSIIFILYKTVTVGLEVFL
jgi:hypothetical protein